MEDKDNKLMLYFIEQTNERLTSIESKLIDLVTFRAEIKTEAKNKAANVAILYAIIGFVLTTVINVLVSIYFKGG